MYRVLYEGNVIYSSGTEGGLAFRLHLSEKENRPAKFSFYLPAKNPYVKSLETGKGEIAVYEIRNEAPADETEIFRGKITEIRSDFQNTRYVECTGVMGYLTNSLQRPLEHINQTPYQFLSGLLERHNEQAPEEEKIYPGEVTVEGSISCFTGYETTLECIRQELLKNMGGRITVRRLEGKNYLDYLAGYQSVDNQAIEFGKNLLDLSGTVDISETYTVCIPLGMGQGENPVETQDTYLTIESVNDGKDYVEHETAAALYGYRPKAVFFRDVTDPLLLKQKGEAWLQENSGERFSLKVTALDCSGGDGKSGDFKPGNEIMVRSTGHGIDGRFPVTERDWYLDEPENNTVIMEKRLLPEGGGETENL